MAKAPATKTNPLANPSRQKLIDLLYAMVDGIDGYESETDRLDRYWDPAAVEEARAILDAVYAASQTSPAPQTP